MRSTSPWKWRRRWHRFDRAAAVQRQAAKCRVGRTASASAAGPRPVVSRSENSAARLCTSAEREILHSLGGGCQLPLGTFVRKDNNDYLMDACIAYPNGEGMLKSQIRSSEGQLTENARKIAADFLHKGGAAMIAHLTELQKTEKSH